MKQAVESLQTSKSESSDSLDSLFDDKDAHNEISSVVIPKEVTYILMHLIFNV